MMKPKVKDLVRKLVGQGGWTEAGQGWEAAEAELQRSGWTRSRKVVVLRRRLPDASPQTRKALRRQQLELPFTEVVEEGQLRWEYSVLVTSLEWEPLTLAQLYRDRADTENAFDELKNRWGWGGFVTQDLNRTRIMVRLNALFYNWWSLFVRMIEPDSRREARTSRPQMMEGVGRVTRHGRQTTLLLTIAHSAAGGLRAALFPGTGPEATARPAAGLIQGPSRPVNTTFNTAKAAANVSSKAAEFRFNRAKPSAGRGSGIRGQQSCIRRTPTVGYGPAGSRSAPKAPSHAAVDELEGYPGSLGSVFPAVNPKAP